MPIRPITDTIPLEEARRLMLEAAVPIARTEAVPLGGAAGRVVASPPTAPIDVPPFDRAAVDGYAVVAEATFGAGPYQPASLRCIERVYTGEVPTRAIGRGECTEVATGAPVPDGADAVVMVEQTEREGDEIRVLTPLHPRQNVGRRGADIAAGRPVLQRGDLLTPARIGAVAAVGVAEIEVYARPRIAILSTGNEIVAPGQRLGPGQIYDINRFTLSAVLGAHGGEPVVHPTVPDSIADLNAAIDAAAREDIVIFSGGTSVGERDLILDAIASRGELIFRGVAVKPGKPTAFGLIGGRPAIGMPGYPTSCLSNAYMLLVPMLRRIARLPECHPRTLHVPIARRIVSITGRFQFFTVRVIDGAAIPAFKASGDITSMSQADGYIEIPAQTDIVEAGEMVEVKLF
jgi:molybdenum cofactor synthesis domain-containing protein